MIQKTSCPRNGPYTQSSARTAGNIDVRKNVHDIIVTINPNPVLRNALEGGSEACVRVVGLVYRTDPDALDEVTTVGAEPVRHVRLQSRASREHVRFAVCLWVLLSGIPDCKEGLVRPQSLETLDLR